MILVTGATGYVGGRLVPRLIAQGYPVRCLVRDPDRLAGRAWRRQVDVATGDLLSEEPLRGPLAGVSAAYYLAHGVAAGQRSSTHDVAAAERFGRAAREAGLARIITLRRLSASRAPFADHERPESDAGDALRASGVSVVELRAGPIVGSGSLSFEMIRCLTERLPVMVCPRWIYTRTQPIGIREVLDYLVASLSLPPGESVTLEIGGADVLTCAEMMKKYAKLRGLRRFMLPVPVRAPRLSSCWVHLVTPIPGTIAQTLIEGLAEETVARDRRARELFPRIQPADYRTAAEGAIAGLAGEGVETSWSDALSSSRRVGVPVVLAHGEGMIVEQRRRVAWAPADAVYQTVIGIGGARGWLYMDWAWRARGLLDRLFGGVGLRRGRRDPHALRVGDALDFWRVEALEPPRLVRLRAEMKVPGPAWLEFQVEARGARMSLLTQTAYFAPKGLLGLAYWYLLYPIHRLIFSGLVRRLAEGAEARHLAHRPPVPG